MPEGALGGEELQESAEHTTYFVGYSSLLLAHPRS